MNDKNLLILSKILVATVGIVSCANQDISQPDRRNQEKVRPEEFEKLRNRAKGEMLRLCIDLGMYTD